MNIKSNKECKVSQAPFWKLEFSLQLLFHFYFSYSYHSFVSFSIQGHNISHIVYFHLLPELLFISSLPFLIRPVFLTTENWNPSARTPQQANYREHSRRDNSLLSLCATHKTCCIIIRLVRHNFTLSRRILPTILRSRIILRRLVDENSAIEILIFMYL
jgi:hypothetical protein